VGESVDQVATSRCRAWFEQVVTGPDTRDQSRQSRKRKVWCKRAGKRDCAQVREMVGVVRFVGRCGREEVGVGEIYFTFFPSSRASELDVDVKFLILEAT